MRWLKNYSTSKLEKISIFANFAKSSLRQRLVLFKTLQNKREGPHANLQFDPNQCVRQSVRPRPSPLDGRTGKAWSTRRTDWLKLSRTARPSVGRVTMPNTVNQNPYNDI